MQRNDIIQTYFQKKELLTTENARYATSLFQLFKWFIQSDEADQDITTNTLQITDIGKAEIITKQSGVIAGLEEIIYLVKKHTKLKIDNQVFDGQFVEEETTILTLSGNYGELLAYERPFVNILGRMSGIATKTNDLYTSLSHQSANIAATRKTPWILMDKKAVAVGGGLTHRLSLADWPMIKDNHLQVLQNMLHISSEKAVNEAIKRMISRDIPFFELEVDNEEQAETAIETFEKEKKEGMIMALLLDNFTPDNAKTCVNKLKKSSIYNSILVEASGGITQAHLKTWGKTGVDIISLGALTHSAQNFDLSMKIL